MRAAASEKTAVCRGEYSMKRKYGVMIATWILWFISILVPLFCVVLKRVPQRFLTVQFLVILLLGILLCVTW